MSNSRTNYGFGRHVPESCWCSACDDLVMQEWWDNAVADGLENVSYPNSVLSLRSNETPDGFVLDMAKKWDAALNLHNSEEYLLDLIADCRLTFPEDMLKNVKASLELQAEELNQPKDILDPTTSKEGKLKVCSRALHPEFTYPLITVAEMSIEKGYKPLNWLDKDNKVTAMYLIEAAQRHLDQVKLGIDRNDKEVTLKGEPCTNIPSHAAQVAYNMLMLDLQMSKDVLIDDRLFYNGEIK